MQRVLAFLKNEDGLAVTEYGVLLALVAVAVLAVVHTFGPQLHTLFTAATSGLILKP
jgi:pilus assembly protein Flp/PilA